MKNFNFKKGLIFALCAIAAVITFTPDILPMEIQEYIIGAGNYSLSAAPLVTIFAKDIEQNIFPKNEFYMQSKDDSAFVVGNSVKHPVAGALPNTEINRSILPAPITKRVDDSNDYDLNEFTSDPTLLQHSEGLIVNYNKRLSILSDHIDTINTKVADYFANIWLPDGISNIVRTTGTAVRVASAPSATGNRKRVIKDDLIALAERFNRMDAPTTGRNIVIPAEFLSDLLLIDGFVEADKIGSSNLVEGQIGRLLGFNIWMRSRVGVYDNTGTPVKKALGAAGAATDNLAALAWVDKWVNRAKGEVKVFTDEDKPEYYGSVFSALVRAGGKKRKDLKGVVALVETAG